MIKYKTFTAYHTTACGKETNNRKTRKKLLNWYMYVLTCKVYKDGRISKLLLNHGSKYFKIGYFCPKIHFKKSTTEMRGKTGERLNLSPKYLTDLATRKVVKFLQIKVILLNIVFIVYYESAFVI